MCMSMIMIHLKKKTKINKMVWIEPLKLKRRKINKWVLNCWGCIVSLNHRLNHSNSGIIIFKKNSIHPESWVFNHYNFKNNNIHLLSINSSFSKFEFNSYTRLLSMKYINQLFKNSFVIFQDQTLEPDGFIQCCYLKFHKLCWQIWIF